MRNILKEKLNEKGKKLTLPNLPGNTMSSLIGLGKIFFHFYIYIIYEGRFDPNFIEERRKGLEEFMNSGNFI